MKLKILLLTILFQISLFVYADKLVSLDSAKVKFSKNINDEYANLLVKDLEYLKNLQPINNQYLAWMMGLEKLNSETLQSWLFERVKIILDEKDNFNEMVKAKRKEVIFPNSDEKIIELEEFFFPRSEDLIQFDFRIPPFDRNIFLNLFTSNSFGTTVVMSNTGSLIYLTSKLESELKKMRIPLKFNTSIDIDIDSPRVGILQIKRGLFKNDKIINSDLDSEANRILRLSVLFHEARHSDGNGKSLTFAHAVCEDHETMGGFSACDRSLNGPYSIEGFLLKEFIKQCKTCTESDRSKLSFRSKKALGRVMLESPAYKHGYERSTYVDNIEQLNKKIQSKSITSDDIDIRIKELEKDYVEWIPAKFYDPAPEYIKLK